MIELFLRGNRVGTLPDDSARLTKLLEDREPVEFRTPNGNRLGTFAPEARPISWDVTMTKEELDRRSREPGFTFEEVKKRLGWE